MLKRHGSNVGLKRQRSSVVDSLPSDAVELILERLPLRSLARFKGVSKKWKSTIDSRRFQERLFIRRRQSRGPDVLLVALRYSCDDGLDDQSVTLGSSTVSTIRFPSSGSIICHGSCEGLLCLYCIYEPSLVVNPATGWHQSFPLSNFQRLINDSFDNIQEEEEEDIGLPIPRLGFGKDKFTGTYKPVWLYNSKEYGLDNITTCEVFDFSTNAWRYVQPSSPHRINDYHYPVYLDGSLHWLTEGKGANVLSFDLHTETFEVLCKTPFSYERDRPFSDLMCILDDRLCVSEKTWPTQVIWSLDSSNKTWNKLCEIDLTKTLSWLAPISYPLAPIAILDKNKLLLQGHDCMEQLMVYDLDAKSFELPFKPKTRGYPLYYFQSLFSALSN